MMKALKVLMKGLEKKKKKLSTISKKSSQCLKLQRSLIGEMTMDSYQAILNRVSKMSLLEREELIKKNNAKINPKLRKQLLDGAV